MVEVISLKFTPLVEYSMCATSVGEPALNVPCHLIVALPGLAALSQLAVTFAGTCGTARHVVLLAGADQAAVPVVAPGVVEARSVGRGGVVVDVVVGPHRVVDADDGRRREGADPAVFLPIDAAAPDPRDSSVVVDDGIRGVVAAVHEADEQFRAG